LRRGVNTWPWFDLTREYPPPRIDYAWPPFQPQRAVPRPVDLVRLRRRGFDFIRLPVDPGPYLAFTGSERTTLLHQLLDAIGEALAAGLKVIVNIQPNEATHYWNSRLLIASHGTAAFAAYRDLVSTLAKGLQGLGAPGQVLLEPVNEPPQACASAEWATVQAALLSAARSAGADVPLFATGACGSMIDGLEQLDPRPLRSFAPVLFTFHYYEPYLFTHQGAPWMRAEPIYRSLNDVPWPSSAGTLEQTLAAVRRRMAADTEIDAATKARTYVQTVRKLTEYFDAQPGRPFIEKAFARVQAWAASHAIPPADILLGEFGALRTDARYVAAPAPDRARYIRDVRMVAEAHGFPWAFWNLFDGMGLMEDDTRRFDEAIMAALGLAAEDP
jgi:hypothetical protein